MEELYWLYVGGAFVLGTIIGSFLNVVILRLHTKRSLNGSSHCLSCGRKLGVGDLIPIVSYIFLRGRCRSCGARFSPRYLFVELLGGLLFAGVVALGLDVVSTGFHLIILSLLLVVFVYDIDHLIIPDEYVVALSGVAVFFSAWNPETLSVVIPSPYIFIAGASSFFFFWALWKISDGRWIGLGDAKLSIPLAMLVGLSSVFSLVVVSFWIGAVVSVSFLLLARLLSSGQSYLRFLGFPLTMKSEVPFAPFLILSYLAVSFGGVDAFELVDWCISFILS